MSLENNLYLRALTKDQAKNMLDSPYENYTHTPDLDNKAFDKAYKANYSFTSWLGRFVCAIPLAAYDAIICSACRLFAAILWSTPYLCCMGEIELPLNQLYHIGKNFEMACGRLLSMTWWFDQKGMEITHRASLDKRCPQKEGTEQKDQFFSECVVNELNNLHDLESNSLEKALFYLENIQHALNYSQRHLLVEKFLDKLFDNEIFPKYKDPKNLITAYKSLINFIDTMDFGSQMFCDIQNHKGIEKKSLLKMFRDKILQHHGEDDGKNLLLDVYNKMSSNSHKNFYLANEYYLQGKENELINTLKTNPETLYFQPKFRQEELTFKLLSKYPEHFSTLFIENKEIPCNSRFCMKKGLVHQTISNYCLGSLAINKKFIISLLIANPKLLETDITRSKNKVINEIFNNKKGIKKIISKIEMAKAVDSRLKFFEGIENLIDNATTHLDEYLKKPWFIEGIAKINKEIYTKLNNQGAKAILSLQPVHEKMVLLSRACITDKKKLPESIRKDIAFRVAGFY